MDASQFINYFCDLVLPHWDEIVVAEDSADTKLELLKIFSEMSEYSGELTEPQKKIDNVYDVLMVSWNKEINIYIYRVTCIFYENSLPPCYYYTFYVDSIRLLIMAYIKINNNIKILTIILKYMPVSIVFDKFNSIAAYHTKHSVICS